MSLQRVTEENPQCNAGVLCERSRVKAGRIVAEKKKRKYCLTKKEFTICTCCICRNDYSSDMTHSTALFTQSVMRAYELFNAEVEKKNGLFCFKIFSQQSRETRMRKNADSSSSARHFLLINNPRGPRDAVLPIGVDN